jgi:hypothetical protein
MSHPARMGAIDRVHSPRIDAPELTTGAETFRSAREDLDTDPAVWRSRQTTAPSSYASDCLPA